MSPEPSLHLRAAGLWLDTDLALGAPAGDVDDGFAVAAVVCAAASGGIPILGVSPVTGNTDGPTAEGCIRALLEALGTVGWSAEAPPVTTETAAPAALARLPLGASVLALGPPTNLVRAARLDSGFPARVEVRVVGRVLSRMRHRLLSWLDLNFRTDRAASREFWRLPWESVRVFPLDVVRRLRFDARDLDRLEAAGGPAAYLARHSWRWLRRAHIVHLSRSFPAWDLPAALDAVGALPGARFTPGPPAFLEDFDVAAAHEAFFRLIGA